jgi:hypothetical protein
LSFISLESPQPTDSATKVAQFFHTHRTSTMVNAYITEVTVVIGFFFFWQLRSYLSASARDRRLATLGFAGILLLLISGAVSAGLNMALVDADKHADASVSQTLNLVGSDVIIYMVGVGVGVFLITSGIILNRGRVLTRWLGWGSFVFGAASLVFGIFGFLGIALWVLIASITILVRAGAGPVVEEPMVATPSELSAAGV